MLCCLLVVSLTSLLFRVLTSMGRRVLLIVLLHDGLMRLVLVVPAMEDRLLLRRRISLARVLPLVRRHGCGAHRVTPIRLVPATVLLLPTAPPVLAPSRRRVRGPSAEVARGTAVVSDGDAQEDLRHDAGVDRRPGAVVPGARVPAVILIDPVHAVVEEEVGVHLRSVVDGGARHDGETREPREMNPDVE